MTDVPSAFDQTMSLKIDTTVPHSARIWNYWLGGTDNYTVDREAGDRYRRAYPGVVDLARASRGFLVRSISYLVTDAGVRQFLDVGSGLPTAGNTHETAQRIAPESRIVYVDHDPLVLVHARALLRSTPEGAAAYANADIRDPDRILRAATPTLDLTEPVALILSGVLGHLGDTAQARLIVKRLMEPLLPGSFLSLNDGTNVVAGEALEEAQEDYNQSGALPYYLRTPEEITSFFEGLELVEPGVVSCPLWRPDDSDAAEPVDAFGGVGRKP